MRSAAALVLAELGSKLGDAARQAVAPAALACLLSLLGNNVVSVRKSAAVAVQRIAAGSPQVLADCVFKAPDSDPSHAAQPSKSDSESKAVSLPGEAAIECLRLACADHSPETVSEAGRALGIVCRILGGDARTSLAQWLSEKIEDCLPSLRKS